MPKPLCPNPADIRVPALGNSLAPTGLDPGEIVWAILLFLLTAKDKVALRAFRMLRGEARSLQGLQRYYNPPGRPGRPEGRHSIDPRICSCVFIAVVCAGLPKAEILRGLGKTALGKKPSSAEYKWLDRRLAIGRASFALEAPDFLSGLEGQLRKLGRLELRRWGMLFMRRVQAPR